MESMPFVLVSLSGGKYQFLPAGVETPGRAGAGAGADSGGWERDLARSTVGGAVVLGCILLAVLARRLYRRLRRPR